MQSGSVPVQSSTSSSLVTPKSNAAAQSSNPSVTPDATKKPATPENKQSLKRIL